MRVGFDATTIHGHKTGVGYYTARLLEWLTRVGGEDNPIDELVVLSNRPVALSEPPPRTTVHGRARFGYRAPWMQGLLPLVLRRLRPDVCHFTNFLAPVATDVPYVVTFHDMSLQLLPTHHTLKKRLLTASLMPEVARRARTVIVPSASARRDVVRLLGLPPEKVRAIAHGVDPLFRPDRSEGSAARLEERYGLRRPYLLYVGTLEPRKNIARAVEAFARLPARFADYHFCLVGELGWKYGPVLRAIEALSLRERVVRLGYVDEADLPALYSHADLFVYPSLYEGFGFPVLEAMACGSPVLTSNGSSLAEIADGAALLVDPTDTKAMTEAMEAVLDDGALAESLRDRGRRRAAAFSWERAARQTLDVYLEAAERSVVAPRASSPPAADALARAVVETVAYGGLFGFPLKLDEIARGLMRYELAPEAVAAILEQDPYARARVERRGPYYALRGRAADVPRRWARERRTRRLLDAHRRFLRFVCRCPFVRMVALSGAAAYGNVADDDIDLFVVTAPRRTWTVFLVLLLAAKLTRRRRVMCINYLLGEDALALPERDPFTACQVVSLRPLAGRDAYLRFVRANDWGAAHYPNFWRRRAFLEAAETARIRAGAPLVEAGLAAGGGFLLERSARALAGWWLGRRFRRAGEPASVRLEPARIKLHFNDHGRSLADRLREAVAAVEAEETPVARRR